MRASRGRGAELAEVGDVGACCCCCCCCCCWAASELFCCEVTAVPCEVWVVVCGWELVCVVWVGSVCVGGWEESPSTPFGSPSMVDLEGWLLEDGSRCGQRNGVGGPWPQL